MFGHSRCWSAKPGSAVAASEIRLGARGRWPDEGGRRWHRHRASAGVQQAGRGQQVSHQLAGLRGSDGGCCCKRAQGLASARASAHVIPCPALPEFSVARPALFCTGFCFLCEQERRAPLQRRPDAGSAAQCWLHGWDSDQRLQTSVAQGAIAASKGRSGPSSWCGYRHQRCEGLRDRPRGTGGRGAQVCGDIPGHAIAVHAVIESGRRTSYPEAADQAAGWARRAS